MKTLIQFWWRIQKLSRQAKIKRIYPHQTSFTTDAKGTSLGRKHKRRKRPTANKPKTIKKVVTGSYILIITLNVNGLNAPTKRHRLAGWMKTCACMLFHLPHCSAWLPRCMQLFYIVKLIMFLLWLAVVITFNFFVWLLIVKNDKYLLLLWLCIFYSLNTIVSWLVNRKIIELYVTKTRI